MREVYFDNNGTIFGVDEFTIENEARLYLWSHGCTRGLSEGQYAVINITIKAGGKAELLSAETGQAFNLFVSSLTINGNGALRTNRLKLTAINVTVDLSGKNLKNILIQFAHNNAVMPAPVNGYD